MIFRRGRLSTAFGLVVLVGAAAHAAEPKLAALTKAYADKHSLPVRIVKNDLGTRQVERHFVPVLPTTHDDFLATFQEANGAVVWRDTEKEKVHGVISVGPGDVISYGSRHTDNLNIAPHATGGIYVTMALTRKQIGAWGAFIDKYTPAGSVPFNYQNNDGLLHFTKAMAATNTTVFGNCMWWVVHADVGGKNLAHVMGVHRAKGPEVLMPRLIHSGNELVGPIGIPVPNLEAFNALSDAQLMGPEPAGGAGEQVKEEE
jgi:hypothetical protein